ncbi:Rpn family recombination-promoting nuclease/putative transposase [Aetokthonos hydrillicola Thurmond2011]|uniref:Rpn family recombination-promoting nuclease/putative transposase n=1 Tax=Aetokthonos hydrillicola Thurmond2011 TaxID=2712845 RepID=A0AAP5IDB8_9CYAN|nr:Rpn family recombination-promoting nuclease/putative transposase [Aetokthonos hydrillicola]MBW4585223.1 Rpn family recombination-promoting nuclease/putative transposase [Aetokthonos hydrillicola CCALA 1050]MDR9899560.1 Rpn family recombination-promoting nuclease/putative transposase [Aetokthonos hydrillicola Thurmond2011]
MKRDSIYYQIFKRFPGLLFELVDHPPQQAQNYRFESVEVKETAFRIDGVFLPPVGVKPRIVFFAEVQFQKDEALYHRFFTELMMYLYRNRSQYDDWFCVVIFPSRSLEPSDQKTHRIFLNSDQVQRIYLDELGSADQQPIGINLMQLTIAPDETMAQQAKQLIERVQLEQIGTLAKNEIIDIVTTIAVYKFSTLSREEVEAMLGLTLEQTRVYQEAKAEGRQEGRQEGQQEGRQEREAEMLKLTVPLLIKTGMSVEQIAQHLNVDLEAVLQAAQ